jgi:hypothetical protein
MIFTRKGIAMDIVMADVINDVIVWRIINSH